MKIHLQGAMPNARVGRGRPSDHQTECGTLEYRGKSQTRLSHACCEGIDWEEVSALAAT